MPEIILSSPKPKLLAHTSRELQPAYPVIATRSANTWKSPCSSRTNFVPATDFVSSLSAAQPDTHQLEANSHQPGQDSQQLAQNSHQPQSSLPKELAVRISEAGSKPRTEVLRALIQDLCRWKALSSRELAVILMRKNTRPWCATTSAPWLPKGC